jgi:elongator complex protein 4
LSSTAAAFCHTFDLAKRLVHPADSKIDFLQLEQIPSKSPFQVVLTKLSTLLANSPPTSVHRVVLPSLLSPVLYPPWSSQPEYVLQFLHGLRGLFADYQGRLTAMMSLPVSIYPRSSGLVRWIELLNDGVIELVPFPHTANTDSQSSTIASGTTEEQPQGLLRLHRLPILHERGSGNNISGDDWAFNMSRRKFAVKPFSLPPIEGDIEAQQAVVSEHKSQKADLDF